MCTVPYACSKPLCACARKREGQFRTSVVRWNAKKRLQQGFWAWNRAWRSTKGRRTPTQGHPRRSKATNPGLAPIPSRLVFGPSGIQSEGAPPGRHQLIVLFPVLARLRLSCSLPPHSQAQRQFTPVPGATLPANPSFDLTDSLVVRGSFYLGWEKKARGRDQRHTHTHIQANLHLLSLSLAPSTHCAYYTLL